MEKADEEENGMKLTTTSRHFEANPELLEFVEQRMRKLKRFWDNILHVDVVMSVEKFRHIAEVNVHVNGHSFSAKEESDNMRTAVDLAAKDLARQMKRFKGKLVTNAHHRGRRSTLSAKMEKVIGSSSVGSVSGLEVVEEVPHDVRDFSVEEAIVFMEDNERNFLLFNNRELGRLNIVYRRSDGNYGLLEKL